MCFKHDKYHKYTLKILIRPHTELNPRFSDDIKMIDISKSNDVQSLSIESRILK